MNNFKKAGSALVLVAASGCLSAGELPNTENMQGLQFNFATPGARSLGMGGAFLGRVDDATAAFANPAGLVNLSKPEISLEYRKLDYVTTHATGGTYPGQGSAEADSDADNLSYFSYVKPGEKVTWAIYRHQLMDFNSAFSTGTIDGVFDSGSTLRPTDNSVDGDIVDYGFSAAFRLSDRASLGIGLQYYDFSFDGLTRRFSSDSSTVANQQSQTGSDDAWGVTLGALFGLSDRLSMGLVYRSTPEFDVRHLNQNADKSTTFLDRMFKLEIPDVLGVGFSFQANDSLVFNLDVNRVSYSDLASPTFWAFTTPAEASADQLDTAAQVGIDDGTSVHLGMEYLLASKPVAIRLGVWKEPGHSLDFNGQANSDWGRANDAFFIGSDDETHIAIGFGVFLEKFSLDFAADFADNQDTVSISGVFYFD